MLILDLDDTIFETKSMSDSSFSVIIKMIRNLLSDKIEMETISDLIEDLWRRPFDIVMNRFEIDRSIQNQIALQINSLDFDLNISTFEDYNYLKKVNIEQVLVTTGFTKLQLTKIKALGIENDFTEIFVDDPSEKNRIYKKGIFQKIIQKSNKSPNQIWVIGDNSESEIKAGNELGLRTILRLKEGEEKSTNAEYSIHSFAELQKIIF
ncbi:MAG: HAD family hydrolase [Saprospiraceae bacterium]